MIRFCGADGLLPSFFSGRLSVTGIADRASFVRVRICDRTIRSLFKLLTDFYICYNFFNLLSEISMESNLSVL